MPRLILISVLGVILLAGCVRQPATPVSAQPLALHFTVNNGKADPPPGRRDVGRGQRVEISVESTSTVQVHVHGYDLLTTAEPGKPGVIQFTADQTGSFDVEVHPDTLLVQLVVR